MNAIKKAAKFVQKNPDAPDARRLIELAVALETNSPFLLSGLFDMDYEAFEHALGVIRDWRVDRHYLSKLRMLELAEMQESAAEPA
jgi:hypothetical protein